MANKVTLDIFADKELELKNHYTELEYTLESGDFNYCIYMNTGSDQCFQFLEIDEVQKMITHMQNAVEDFNQATLPNKETPKMSDKRSVMTDALETLGTIIDETATRDAVHIAVLPIQAFHDMSRGERVKIKDGKAHGTSRNNPNYVGIVDPYLEDGVKEGEWFWLNILPRKITSLQHVWAHPDIPTNTQTPTKYQVSEKWLRDFAELSGLSYPRLLDITNEWVEYDENYVGGDEVEGVKVPEVFWLHYQNILGWSVPEDKQENFFSCSC